MVSYPNEDQPLLIQGNSFLVLNFNSIHMLNINYNSFTSQLLHKKLHITWEMKGKQKGKKNGTFFRIL